ncbi:MAG: hypothetical protein GY702_28760 [Desulfobulbaceae bacterium]|nr:hypothetical protein [Desulfobulbaceae bacterium]
MYDDSSQYTWLTACNEMLGKDVGNMNISWSAHFAETQDKVRPPAKTALLPLFRENAHSLAMIKHGMNVAIKTTTHLNPLQTPVLTLDQRYR